MKIIKFDLPINGTKVKTLQELRDNLTDEILALARSSQLERWLRTRQLPEQAQAVAAAVSKQEGTDKGLFLALCKVLEVEVHPDDVTAIFDAPPAPGRFIPGARYFELYQELKNSLDKKDVVKNIPGKEALEKEISNSAKKTRNLVLNAEFLDLDLINRLILNGGGAHVKGVYVKQGSVLLKGSLIADVGFGSSVIRINSPVSGVVEKISVELGSYIRIGGGICSIAEKQA